MLFIKIKKIFHRGDFQIGLFFDFDENLKNKAKSIGSHWSQTHKCWYVLYNKENNALKENWGKDNVWDICQDLNRFKHYHVDGVKDLVYSLKDYNNTSSHFMENIYCNYIEATGDGYEILWEWVTRDISVKEMNTRNKENELHCENHDLKDGDFLKKHLKNSEEFLNLVLNSLLDWVESSYYWKEDGLTCKLLEFTSIHDSVSHFGSIYVKNISILIQAVEEAFLNHARNKNIII